jgi:hypothetical protein
MSVLFPCVEADGCVWFGLYRVKIGDWMVLGGLRLGKWTRQWHPPTQFLLLNHLITQFSQPQISHSPPSSLTLMCYKLATDPVNLGQR